MYAMLCHLWYAVSFMLSVAIKSIMLIVVMLNVTLAYYNITIITVAKKFYSTGPLWVSTLWDLSANIRRGWEWLTVANTSAYHIKLFITTVKAFIAQAIFNRNLLKQQLWYFIFVLFHESFIPPIKRWLILDTLAVFKTKKYFGKMKFGTMLSTRQWTKICSKCSTVLHTTFNQI